MESTKEKLVLNIFGGRQNFANHRNSYLKSPQAIIMQSIFVLAAIMAVTSLVSSVPVVVDMTHTLGKDTSLFWPGQPPFNFTNIQRGYNQDLDAW